MVICTLRLIFQQSAQIFNLYPFHVRSFRQCLPSGATAPLLTDQHSHWTSIRRYNDRRMWMMTGSMFCRKEQEDRTRAEQLMFI